MFQRNLFKKPIDETQRDMASGTVTSFFTIPWNKLGFLKRVEIKNDTQSAANITIRDNYNDSITSASGYDVKKEIYVGANSQYDEDIKEDIPLLEEVSAESTVSGCDITLTARTN